MHTLRLDYTNTPVWWTRQGLVWLAVGVVLVIALGTYYGHLVAETGRAAEALDAARELTNQERMGNEKLTGELKTLRAEIKESQTVLARLTIPWDPLFIAVEQVQARHHDRISLTAIHPDVAEQRVILDGRAPNLDELLDFVRELPEYEIISRAYLSHHQREDKDAAKPVRFSIVAEWNTKS